jgi:hypothetical protein
MRDSKKEIYDEGLKQLAEKQMEEMDQMLAKRYGLPKQTHTDDAVRGAVFSDLLSGIPVAEGRDDAAELGTEVGAGAGEQIRDEDGEKNNG